MKYSEIRDQIQSFDILVFSGGGAISRLIQFGTRSKWSHVALALRLEEFDQVLCYESTTLSKLKDISIGKHIEGVQLVPLSERVQTYEGDIAWRAVTGPRTPEMGRAAGQVLREFKGRPYEENNSELIKAALDILPGNENHPDTSSLFCSELAALLHRAVGILTPETKKLPANEFTPADFSDDLPFAHGYAAGQIIDISGD